ncbi:hypothetical protein [Waltera sp.]|uniref:hypothetical protein n=1 Tax=Waltera sp. TaxID=2815806 RepID=UPI0039908103
MAKIHRSTSLRKVNDLKMIMERLKTQHNITEERIVSCRYDSMEYEDMTAKQMYAQLRRLSPDKPICFSMRFRNQGLGKGRQFAGIGFDVDLYGDRL